MKCFYANVIGKQQNKIYPNFKEVVTREDLIEVVSHDYVGAEYDKNTRSNKNFISSDCLMLDCDNDHSEDPSLWVDALKYSTTLPKQPTVSYRVPSRIF